MFGNTGGGDTAATTNNESPVESQTLTSTGPLTMETLLGNKLADAQLIEGGLKPKGIYAFTVDEIKQGNYSIKADDHPHQGQEALMLSIVSTIIAVDPESKYVNDKGKVVTNEQMQSYVGKKEVTNIMFGNDGLPDENGTIKQSGLNQLVTYCSKIIGKEVYDGIDAESENGIAELMDATVGSKYTAEMVHNRYTTADGNERVDSRINLLGDFTVIPD